MGFLQKLGENVARYPDKPALEFMDPPLQRLTYAELDDLICRTAAYLRGLGLEPGDRIALQLTKSLEFILLHLAVLRCGAISLPLNLAYPADELKYFLEDSAARLFFSLEATREKIAPLVRELTDLEHWVSVDPAEPERFLELINSHDPLDLKDVRYDSSQTATIVYTSGTTGRPKGAEITHGNLSSNLDALHAAWGWRADDVLLHVLPIFHVHGLFVALHGALHAGATTLLMREFDARRAIDVLSERNCTVFMAVPTIHARLLNLPDARDHDLSRLRLITSGSDRLPNEVFEGFQKTFGYTLLERYGMTETGMNCSNPLDGERRIGSVGLPLPGVEVRIADPEDGHALQQGDIGEVQLRGPNIFKGYWKQPDKTRASFTADGWFHTGDLGFLEADGYLTLCGRSKDLIITGGLNVYPPEVERVLNEHAAVAASAVIGCPDSEWGERVTAVVVLEPGAAATPEELIAFCRNRLAPYKSPKAVVFAEALPRNAMGKVQKGELRKSFCQPAG